MPDRRPSDEARADPDLPTGFGPTGFGRDRAAARPPAPPGSVFDVCHAGVVLRALLFVHGVLAIAAMFNARSLSGWALGFATASAAALPGVLIWLLAACASRRRLEGWPVEAQWAAVLLFGAACGAAGTTFAGLVAADATAEPLPWPAAAFAGAAFAAALLLWLRMRAAALPPAAAAARLAELQSRIRPHFLFNTLNTALALVHSDPPRAEAVLEDLAELFRFALTDDAESTTLAAELQLAERYLAIEQIRFGARLRLVWELDPAAGGARMPPLLLQPLVENAVRHGVEPADAGGTVRIRTEAKAGRARVSIVNTLPAAASVPGSGMALANVRERLRLMHDVAMQFDARREADVYRVRIVVPLGASP